MGRDPKLRRTTVFFRWECPDVNCDEDVRVVGNCPELGNWNPCNGSVLSRSDRSSCWTSQIGVSLLMRSSVEYKYVICKRSTGELVRWEGEGENRAVVPTGLNHTVEDDDGAFRNEMVGDNLSASQDRLSELGTKRAPAAIRKASVDEFSEARTVVSSSSLQRSFPSNPNLQDKLKEFEEQISKELTCDLAKDDRVFLVFQLLPLTVEYDTPTGDWKVVEADTSQDSRVLSSLLHFTAPDANEQYGFQVTFIGHPGVYVKEESDRRKITQVLAPFHCIPVFVDEDTGKEHLNLCHRFLWPVFHNMKVFDGGSMLKDSMASGLALLSEAWKSFLAVNVAYAKVIEQNGSPSTLVWVHDYHLLLVPRQLYLRRPDFKISFFLHSAFPSSEVLQCLPNREDILQSLLSANLVSFQIFDYSRNFISCCSQLLRAQKSFRQGGLLQVEHDGRATAVTTNHCVVPFQVLATALDDPEVKRQVAQVREKFRGKTIIAAYDKCDRFAGLAVKLRILCKFLVEYDRYVGKIVFLQYVSPTSDNGVEDREGLMKELETMAAEINKKFNDRNDGKPVVVLKTEELSKAKMLAHLQAADILLNTSIRDGLNLTPFMFCVAHSRDKKGAIIVSEFCGCSCALTGAYKINPWNTRSSMETLDNVLSEKQAVLDANYTKNLSYVSTQSLVKWVTQNMSELKAVCQQGRSALVEVSGKMRALSSHFKHLDVDNLLRDYRNAKTRAIFLDTEGTLASKAGWKFQGQAAGVALMKEGTPIDEDVLECLRVLASDRGNTLVVLSGRKPSFLEQWYETVQGIGLCAEHSFYWVPPVNLRPKGINAEDKWLVMGRSQDDDDWKAIAVEFLTLYIKRVQGSILENKNTSVAWRYEGVGAPEVMNLIAQEVARFLNPDDPEGLMYGYPVKVVCGKGYVEVKRSDVDKGVAVTRTLENMKKTLSSPIDFVLCIGDDRSDEDMFEAVEKYFKKTEEANKNTPDLYSLADTPEPMSPSSGSQIRLRGSSGEERPRGSSHEDFFPAGQMMRQISNELPDALNRVKSKSRNPLPHEGETNTQAGLISARASTVKDKSKTKMLEVESNLYYTVTVGRKPSKAKFFVTDVDAVSKLLSQMATVAVASSFSRYSSMPELCSQPNGGRSTSSSSLGSDHVQEVTFE